MLIVALFIMASHWKLLKCPQLGIKTNKPVTHPQGGMPLCHKNIKHKTAWLTLEALCWRKEVRHKRVHSVIRCTWNSRKGNSRGTERAAGARGDGRGKETESWDIKELGGDGNCGGACTTMYIFQNSTDGGTLRTSHTAHELYLNKMIKHKSTVEGRGALGLRKWTLAKDLLAPVSTKQMFAVKHIGDGL